MMRTIASSVMLVFAIFTHAPGKAESWDTTKTVCHDAVKPKVQFHAIEECIIDGFTLKPFGPAFGNIGAGSGFGAGARYVKPFDFKTAKSTLTLRGLYSLKSFYLFEGLYSIALPRLTRVDPSSTGQIDDARGAVTFEARRVDFRTQDFYGSGPDSALAGHAVYRLLQNSIGTNAFIPTTSWSGIGGDLHYIQPLIKGGTGGGAPSISTIYGEGAAPGLTARTDFVEVGAWLGIRTPSPKISLPWESHAGKLMYEHFSELGSNQYSFNRLSASASVSAETRTRLKDRWASRSRWKDAICMSQVGDYCTYGTFTYAGLMTASYTGDRSAVPFYLQPTLGGMDVDGLDTLRGLVDYRLRAPSRLLVQAAFDKPLSVIKCGPGRIYCGAYGIYAFFDAGNVEQHPGDLSFMDLKTDVGVGISWSIQNKVIVRAYIAFGAGEGSHPNAKIARAF